MNTQIILKNKHTLTRLSAILLAILLLLPACAAPATPTAFGPVEELTATGIALKLRLLKEGAPVINTPLLGAFAKATGVVSLETIEKALRSKLPAAVAWLNFETVGAAFEGTVVKKAQG